MTVREKLELMQAIEQRNDARIKEWQNANKSK